MNDFDQKTVDAEKQGEYAPCQTPTIFVGQGDESQRLVYQISRSGTEMFWPENVLWPV